MPSVYRSRPGQAAPGVLKPGSRDTMTGSDGNGWRDACEEQR
jgi:hypothetical protein